jgi:asparagine synthase (glutamine-hydrolysing)
MGVDLRVRTFTQEEVEERLVEIMEAVEETGQLQVEVAIPMYLAAEKAADDGIRVVFTGQGADEVHGGYDWYRGILPEGVLALHYRMWHDFGMLYEETLEREDKLTMAHSLEQRAPYLDRALVTTSMRLSPRLKVRGEDDRMRKWVHRRVATDLGVPESLAYRTKDPAQTGSGIHDMIEEIAERRHPCPDPALARRNRADDKGSLFRYEGHRRESYGSDRARSFLEYLARQPERQEVLA